MLYSVLHFTQLQLLV